MDYYDIINLLVFLRNQNDLDFKDIKRVVGVIEDKSIPDENKGELFLKILREAGLYELTQESQMELEKEEQEILNGDCSSEVPIAIYTVQLMNTKVNIWFILN